jgi:hypothetical protein
MESRHRFRSDSLSQQDNFGARSPQSRFSRRKSSVAGLDLPPAGSTHSFDDFEEATPFASYINALFLKDELLMRHLPLKTESDDIFKRCKDGLIFLRLIDQAKDVRIDWKKVNTGEKIASQHQLENLNLAIDEAKIIGCHMVNIRAEDIVAEKPIPILGMLWQIIRAQLMPKLSFHAYPELTVLLFEGETRDQFLQLTAEQILLRWVNHHLKRSGSDKVVKNFGESLREPLTFCSLLNRIDSSICKSATATTNKTDLASKFHIENREPGLYDMPVPHCVGLHVSV